jgi:hypothetical protein
MPQTFSNDIDLVKYTEYIVPPSKKAKEPVPRYADPLQAQPSHTAVINKRLLMHPHGPLSGVRKNFKKAYPYRNLHYRISMQLHHLVNSGC